MQLLSVVAPIAPFVEVAAMAPVPADVWQERRETQLESVRAQLRRTIPQACEWPIAVMEGEGGEAIARYAREHHARLVVMGRGRHGVLHRLVAPETVLRVLRFSDAPVLAVEQHASAPPRRVVVATDFSAYTTYAARVALSLAAPDAIVYLTHVRPRSWGPGRAAAHVEHAYREALPVLFERVREHIRPPATVTIETVTLGGDPGSSLIEFAAASRADLVVSGAHGIDFIHRLVLGSVATELLRRAPCSVLCVPGLAITHAAARSEATEYFLRASIPMAELPRELAAFSKRNGGRLGAIELTPPGLESHVLAAAILFLGADFDCHDRAITLLFGASRLEGAHLTHAIRDVRGVDLLTDTRGADRGLVLQSVAGTTALRLLAG